MTGGQFLIIIGMWIAYLTVPTVFLILRARRILRSEEFRREREENPTPPDRGWRSWLKLYAYMGLVDLYALAWPVTIPVTLYLERRSRAPESG